MLKGVLDRVRRLVGAARESPPRTDDHPHTHSRGHGHEQDHARALSEAELLARADEFNRNADRYWKAVGLGEGGRRHVLDRPFSGLNAPGDVHRLGLVMAELRPGPGVTVLDFGAGTCWLSSCLNRLGCRTVSVDISPAALALGRELFALDRRHRGEPEPRFLDYDGHTLPLPDDSVDRIACYDAFHHVPNQDEVLREMFRVLRPGGRVVLSEPGEGHAHADISVFEEERFGVLENEFDLLDFERRARRVGFTDVKVKPYLNPSVDCLSPADYVRLSGPRSGLNLPAVRAGVGVVEALRNSFRVVSIVVLGKGEQIRDSRSPGMLRAEMRLVSPAGGLYGRVGGTVRAVLAVRNTGDTRWRHEPDPLGGTVFVACHLLAASGPLVQEDFLRTPLPRDVGPGEEVQVVLALPLPPEPGRYVVRFDPVDADVAWFSQVGSPPLAVPLEVVAEAQDRTYRAALSLLEGGGALTGPAGARLLPRFAVKNVGLADWPLAVAPGPGAIRLGAQLLDGSGAVIDRDYGRLDLPHPVAAGEGVDVVFPLRRPPQPGRYGVKVDLLQEHVCWFEQRGSSPLRIDLEVTDEVADSTNPGILSARLELLHPGPAVRAQAGQAVRVRVRATNLGNTRWRHAVPEGEGYVRLGARLRPGDGSPPRDYWRASLGVDVAPGETVEVATDLEAPEEAGGYTVLLDLVDEGWAWFASEGSTAVAFSLEVSPRAAPQTRGGP